MAPNPLKPLITGLCVMLLAAGATLFVHAVRLTVIAEQERVAESQRRSKEMRERAEREMEANRQAAQLRREQEAARAKQAAEAKARGIDLAAAFDRKLSQAASGDANAQFLTGYVYHVGMDRIVGMRDSRLTVLNNQVITMLIGEPLTTKPLVSIPTFSGNELEAIQWFERAARQGHQGAQAQLGMAHAGRGNYAPAYQWMLIAEGPRLPDEITVGTPPVQLRNSMKENFRKRLTPEQSLEAERFAKEFKPTKEAR